MNCDRALLALLDAELPDLATSTTPLAVHVRNCARCHRVADRFISETHLMAMAMPASGARRRTPAYGNVFAPFALAASLLVVVAVQRQESTPIMTAAATLPPVILEPAPAVAHVVPVATLRAPRRVAREFPRAIPIAAVKLDGTASLTVEPPEAIPTRTVSVTPAAGTRAVVMQTSDPRIVVVWLY